MDAPTFNEQTANRIARAVARKDRALFYAFPDIGVEDLVQHGVSAAIEAWPSYRPEKSGPATFMWGLIGRRLIDLFRRRACELRHLTQVRPPEAPADSTSDGWEDHWPATAEIAQWCRDNRVRAQTAFGNRLFRVRREFHSLPELAAVVLLMNRLRLTPAETVKLLHEEPEIAGALRFMHVPAESYFRRAGQLLAMGQRRELARGQRADPEPTACAVA